MQSRSINILAVILIALLTLSGCATPLTTAVQNRDIREIHRLLDAGANINEPGGDPARTPLAWSIRYRYFDVVKLLIEKGADVNFGFPLHSAIEAGDISVVNLLLDKGADVNNGYYGFGSPLMAAAQEGKTAIVERLLEKGAELDGALVTCKKYNSTFGLRGNYDPCVTMLSSIKAKREAAAQQQPAAKPGVSKEEIASIVQAAVERSQKAQDRKTEKEQAYLVPYDGDPNYLPNTGYALKRLYDSLSRLRAREVVVVLDACFSGSGGRSVLAKGARPLVMTTAALPAAPNLAVLTATQGAQISTSSSDKGHGIFTYYFLKALKDGKKNVAEIYEYLKPQVEDDAKAINVQQSPSLNPAPEKLTGRFNLRK